MKSITFVALVSNKYKNVFNANLCKSPPLNKQYNNELIVVREFSVKNACVSLNNAVDISKNDIIVFAQSDVYLPIYWDIKLHAIINTIEEKKINWGILGIFGTSKNNELIGHVYSNGLQRELGRPRPPIEATSIDETLFVLNKKSGVRFDDNFPYLCLYGNDMLINASNMGYLNFIISNFLVHNSVTMVSYQRNELDSVEYFRRKWPNKLPFYTPYLTVYPQKWRNICCKFKLDLLNILKDNKNIITTRHKDPSSIRSTYNE